MSLQTTFSILYVVSNLTVATLFASLKELPSFLPGILVGQSFHTFLCQYLTQPDRGVDPTVIYVKVIALFYL